MLANAVMFYGLATLALLLPVVVLAALASYVIRGGVKRMLATALVASTALGLLVGWGFDGFSSSEAEGMPSLTERLSAALPFMLIAIIDSLIAVRLVSRHID